MGSKPHLIDVAISTQVFSFAGTLLECCAKSPYDRPAHSDGQKPCMLEVLGTEPALEAKQCQLSAATHFAASSKSV